MLLILTFVACLSGKEPDRCETIELAWDGSLMQCQLFGQTAAADWIREHEGYRFRGRYFCSIGRSA